ncbi:hypothetical protein FDUTEX481_01188 [Tolypothrix sp. PCC 7601]|nr:hypothetical protein FDUTEX481_01188 [Tolypothrix sp. PCC 7601]
MVQAAVLLWNQYKIFKLPFRYGVNLKLFDCGDFDGVLAAEN